MDILTNQTISPSITTNNETFLDNWTNFTTLINVPVKTSNTTTTIATIIATSTMNKLTTLFPGILGHHTNGTSKVVTQSNISTIGSGISSSSVPAIIHFTYYELNFFDIVFIVCGNSFIQLICLTKSCAIIIIIIMYSFFLFSLVFFFKFFITSLFIIFALVSINGNSYPQLLQRISESRKMSIGDHYGTRSSLCRHRRDLIFTFAALNIISGNLHTLMNYISVIQRFIYCTSWQEKIQTLEKIWNLILKMFCCRRQSKSSTSTKIHNTPTPPTPTVVFIDSEPEIEIKENNLESNQAETISSSLKQRIQYKPTLKIRVKNIQDGTSTIVRALLDPNSACSYISETVVNNLRLPKYFVWPCFFRCFPGPKCEYVYQSTKVVLQSVDQYSNATNVEHLSNLHTSDLIELLIPSCNHHSRILPFGEPPQILPITLQEMLQNSYRVTLSDGQLVNTSISHNRDLITSENPALASNIDDPQDLNLIIGQDLLYSIIQVGQNPHRIIVLGEDLFVIKTAFGWTVHGTSDELNAIKKNNLKTFSVKTENFGIISQVNR